jgi:DNA-binding NarL/FixJ family response regulator
MARAPDGISPKIGAIEMEHPVRSDVRVALCETHPALRSGFQTALYRRGLRNIEVCKDSGALITLLQNEIIDLVICATDLPGLDFCDLIQQIRHGNVGRNPFTLVLATVADATLDDIRRIMNAGVDRVAVKPMSMGDMTACVNALAVSRKPFVATESYVGPSRRGTARADQRSDEAMDAPNTLQFKMTGSVPEQRLDLVIGQGRNDLISLRDRTTCLAVARSSRRVIGQFNRHGAGAIARELTRLHALSATLESHYRASSDYYLSEVATNISQLADLLLAFPAGQEGQMQVAVALLDRLGEVVRLAALGERQAVTTMRSIIKSVQGFIGGLGAGASAMFEADAQWSNVSIN